MSYTYAFLLYTDRSTKYWWELVVLARKYAIITASTFVQSDIRQLHIVLAVLVISLHLHDRQQPFGSRHGGGSSDKNSSVREYNSVAPLLHGLEMWSLLVLMFLLWSGIYFYISGTSGDGLCVGDVGACYLLAAVVVGSNVLYVVVISYRCAREWGKRNHVVQRFRDVSAESRMAVRQHFKTATRVGKAKVRSNKAWSLDSASSCHIMPVDKMFHNPLRWQQQQKQEEHNLSVDIELPVRNRRDAGTQPPLPPAPQRQPQNIGGLAQRNCFTRYSTRLAGGSEFFVNNETGVCVSVWDLPDGAAVNDAP